MKIWRAWAGAQFEALTKGLTAVEEERHPQGWRYCDRFPDTESPSTELVRAKIGDMVIVVTQTRPQQLLVFRVMAEEPKPALPKGEEPWWAKQTGSCWSHLMDRDT